MNQDKASGGGAGVEPPDPFREFFEATMEREALDSGSDVARIRKANKRMLNARFNAKSALAQTKPAPEPAPLVQIGWFFPPSGRSKNPSLHRLQAGDPKLDAAYLADGWQPMFVKGALYASPIPPAATAEEPKT